MVHSLKEAETRETLRRCHANQQREALLPATWRRRGTRATASWRWARWAAPCRPTPTTATAASWRRRASWPTLGSP